MTTEMPAGSNWFSLCSSLIDRTKSTFLASPVYYVVWAAIFYVPAMVFYAMDPIADPWIGTCAWFGLLSFAFVMSGGAALFAVQDVREGETPSLASGKERVMGVLTPLLITAAIGGLLMALGMLVVVPGLLVLTWIFLAGPITIEENLKGWPAIDRGRRFIEDYRWTQVAGALFLGYAGRMVLQIIPRLLTRGFHLMFSELPSFAKWFLQAVSWSLDIAVISVLSVWICVAYLDITELLTALAEFQEKEKQKAVAAGITLPSISLPKSGFTPPPHIQALIRRVGELAMMCGMAYAIWYAMSPHPIFERPPTTLTMSDVKLVSKPTPHIHGHIVNDAGAGVKKAVWLVKMPEGTKGVPPTLVITNLNQGDQRDFDIPLPVELTEMPPIRPFRIEWSQ
jgi:hypothetical protein